MVMVGEEATVLAISETELPRLVECHLVLMIRASVVLDLSMYIYIL